VYEQLSEKLHPGDDYDNFASTGTVLTIMVGPVSLAQAWIMASIADEVEVPSEVLEQC
jgi:hypothetical protein